MHVNVVSHFSRNPFTFTVSWPGRGRWSRVDLHPCHLVCHLLHCGWRAVMLGVGGVWSWHVPSCRVVMLRNRRPENTKTFFKHMDKDPGRIASTTRAHTHRDAWKQTNKQNKSALVIANFKQSGFLLDVLYTGTLVSSASFLLQTIWSCI